MTGRRLTSSGLNLARVMKAVSEMTALVLMCAFFVVFAMVFQAYPADRSYAIMLFNRGFTIEKITLFAIFLLACAVNALLFLCARFPRLYKYPVKVTAENIEAQYHLAKIMFALVQCFVALLFMLVVMHMYLGAADRLPDHSYAFAMIPSAGIGGTVAVYLGLAYAYR